MNIFFGTIWGMMAQYRQMFSASRTIWGRAPIRPRGDLGPDAFHAGHNPRVGDRKAMDAIFFAPRTGCRRGTLGCHRHRLALLGPPPVQGMGRRRLRQPLGPRAPGLRRVEGPVSCPRSGARIARRTRQARAHPGTNDGIHRRTLGVEDHSAAVLDRATMPGTRFNSEAIRKRNGS